MVSLESFTRYRECINCGRTFDPIDMRQIRCTADCRAGTARFISIDGEGLGEDPSCYVLLGCGKDQIHSAQGLSWQECFSFLYRCFESNGPGCAYVGFYLGYDFTCILSGLPADRAYMLFTTAGQALRKHRIPGKEHHPVDCDGWQFDILGSKRLRIRPKTCSCEYATCPCPDKKSWMYICDAGGFWQSSFMTVIDPKNWGEPIVSFSDYEIIKAGKAKRASAYLDDDMRRYNHLENQTLSTAMDQLRKGFSEIGISLSPRQWFGPGQAASAWLKGRLPRSKDYLNAVPSWFLAAAQASYFGGWFEQMMHGHIPGITHEYDINSAYPHIIASLRCLEHGTYSRGQGSLSWSSSEYVLVRARVWTHTPGSIGHSPIGAMLHRMHDGNIIRPRSEEHTSEL